MAQSQSRSKGAISSPQRMSVRLALATGATVAALVGAQALASTSRANASVLNNTTSTSTSNQSASTDNTFLGQNDQSLQFNSSNIQPSIQSAVNQPNPFTQSSR